MQFDIHTNKIISKALGTIMFINRVKENFNKETRITVIQSLVLSIINYGIKIWGTANQTQLDKVQKIQNFEAKVAHRRSH